MDALIITNHLFWGQILAAVFCGSIIGLERQLRGKPIGIRTSILICLGTAMFVVLGEVHVGAGDPTRVMGQVVTGIGFLGAGLIMNKHGLISGVTSAATVWVLAAVGCAVGLQRFDVALAVAFTTLGVLVGIRRLEQLYSGLRRGVHQDLPEDEGE